MSLETGIRNTQKVMIKACLSRSTLVPSGEQDRVAFWIKGVGHAPCASICIETQLLHVRVP